MTVRNDFAPGEFCWIDLSANDLESAIAWYGDLFGWVAHKMPTPGDGPPYAFFMQGQVPVAGIGELNAEMKQAGVPPAWNNYIATADCAATEAKVKELGGTVTVPTMEVPGHGKLAFFMDPEGASFAAWEALSKSGPGFMKGEPGSLSWNELMTRDTDQAKSFYGSLIGWEFTPMQMEGADYTMLKVGKRDAGGMMSMADARFDGVPAHWILYFDVADCEATAAKVAATGGKVIMPPTQIPMGAFSIFSDPQGAVFAVIQLKENPGC